MEEKNEKGKRKTEENYIKNDEKASHLIRRGKNIKEGGGDDRNAQYGGGGEGHGGALLLNIPKSVS